MKDAETAIKIDHVYKDFLLPHEKADSVKNVFTHMFSYISSKQSYGTQHALQDVSIDIKKGEFFGIVGRNGSGKSTLLKMIAAIYQPTKGSIQVNGKLVPFIELGVGFNGELTGRENVYLNGALLGFTKKEMDAKYKDIVEFAELEAFMDQKLKNYSSGMQVRLAFSLAIRVQTDILLVDEVLAVGDADFQRKCFNYFKELKAQKKTVIFVTHDMSAVREFCDRAMLIESSKVMAVGDPRDIAREYSLLFMEDSNSVQKDGKRWGKGDIKIEEAKASIEKNEVVIRVKAKAKKGIDGLIYGIHVIASDGKEITAMNNRMILEEDIKNLSPNDTVEFEWRMLNIFNDGDYSITLTLVSSIFEDLDWYTEAARFRVKRAERSTTAVLPPLKVSHKIKR